MLCVRSEPKGMPQETRARTHHRPTTRRAQSTPRILHESEIEHIDAALAGETLVNLNGADLGDDGARHLATLLKENTTLTILGISGNGFGTDGAREIAASLQQNATLTDLHIPNNPSEKLGAGRWSPC